MILKKLVLKNFRIHRNSEITFSENVNYIVGGNGQGKTSILEAIYFLCTTKGYNSASDAEVINFNENEFEIDGEFSDLTESKTRLYYSRTDNKKFYFIDHKQYGRAASIIGRFPVVILTPSDHSITQGSPSDRRKFVDSVISQASRTYLQILLEYNKTLRQRSSLLSQIKESYSTTLIEQLDAWTEELVNLGSQLIELRMEFTSVFITYVASAYKLIMGEKEMPGINYFYFDGKYSGALIRDEFHRLLKEKRGEEIRRASNLVGPQKDDFNFAVNGIDLKKFGSQGQHKTFQIALRFAQFYYLKDAVGRTPLFLMDDVFGELDAYRAGKISEHFKEVGQTFITLTDLSDFSYLETSETDKIIKVEGGTIL